MADGPINAHVSIANFAFAPTELVMDAGQSVTWSSDDGAPHGLAFRNEAQGPEPMLPGADFTRVFDGPGSFDYVCAAHAYLTARGTVRSSPPRESRLAVSSPAPPVAAGREHPQMADHWQP